MVAPTLWLEEYVTIIRQSVHYREITPDRGREAVDRLFTLGVDTYPPIPRTCQRAFDRATRLGQRRAYDSFYLALAELLRINLWSVDERLVNGARAAGAEWVHWVREGLTDE